MAPYSGRNKIPTIEKLGKDLAQRLSLRSGKVDPRNQEEYSKQAAKTRRKVVDPTTKNQVTIQDVDGDFESSIRRPKITVPKANIDPTNAPEVNDLPGVPGPHLPQGSDEEYRETLDDLAPPEANPDKTADLLHHSKNHTVLYHPLPLADLDRVFKSMDQAMIRSSLVVTAGLVTLNWLFVGGGFKGIIASLLASIIISSALHLFLRNMQASANAINWQADKMRAKAATESLVPESVEWMNSLVGIVWKLINPEMFAAMADTLEDVMQASVPQSVIENVKVTSIGQGDMPFKILSLRALPSAEDTDDHEKTKKAEQRELEGENDDDYKYYNLEASFAYHAIPAKGVIGKAKNMHLEIVFYLGVKGVFAVPLPIFVELNGIIGTVRLRFQLTPNPPFLKNVTFTFMGLPKIDASAIPMTSRGINVLDLPLIAGFVNSSIAAALDEYVAPKSLIMDMSKLLQGDAVKKDTDALGLIYIHVKTATGISAQDRNGKSDPFVTLAFDKPAYCTRIIEQELNPSWNEQVCLPIYQEQLVAGEKLKVELWDSDKVTSDDVVGKIDFDIRELIRDYTGKICERHDTLKDADGKELPGLLHWDIGYFPKSAFKASMRTHGLDTSLPKALREKDEFKDDRGVINTQGEADVVSIPPDPTLPSGICTLLIHQIENLEVHRASGTFGSYEPWTPAQQVGENTDEEGGNLPSSYCTILCNDELVFKTRTKVKSSKPIFNAQTERFIRDWRSAVFTVSCRNQTHREHDSLIGSVTIKLSEVLRTSSQTTAYYALDGGMGYGRLLVSVLFRSVDVKLPPNLLGYNVGSVEILGDHVQVTGDALKGCSIRVKTDVGKDTIHAHWATDQKYDLRRVAPDLQRRRLLLPVKQRYQTSIRFEFKYSGKTIAYGLYWLCDLVDNNETVIEVPVYKTPMAKQMTQNYISNIDRDKIEADKVGRLYITLRFKMGLDESHAERMRIGNDDRETFETWQSAIAEGYRTHLVKRQTPDTVKELHKEGKITGDVAYSTDPDAGAGQGDEEDGDADDVPRIPRFKPGVEHEIDDYRETSTGEQLARAFGELKDYASEKSYASDDPDSLEIQEDYTDEEIDDDVLKKRRQRQDKKAQKAELHRKQRGFMHLKPVRNLKFIKDETRVLGHKIKNRFSMTGREPGVETEI
ncbi:hypothetical protein PYCC9005_004118 [Savitreella phatthalungensis]